jgi:hypothetical protein
MFIAETPTRPVKPVRVGVGVRIKNLTINDHIGTDDLFVSQNMNFDVDWALLSS